MAGIVFLGHTKVGCRFPAHSERDWDRVLVACAFRCFYCTRILDHTTAQKDHLVPLSRNGCNCRGNLVASCLNCNSMKGNKTVGEFLEMRPALLQITGKFYTGITALEPLCSAKNDPLLREIYRLASRKAFPRDPIHTSSWAWRNHP